MDYHLPDVTLSYEPYPFGSVMSERSFSSGDYRYGFNGKESDDEVKGSKNSLDFGARIYDPRLGRFLSLDPRIREFPDLSPYVYAANNPIFLIDENGEGPTRAEINRSRVALLKVKTVVYLPNSTTPVPEGQTLFIHGYGTVITGSTVEKGGAPNSSRVYEGTFTVLTKLDDEGNIVFNRSTEEGGLKNLPRKGIKDSKSFPPSRHNGPFISIGVEQATETVELFENDVNSILDVDERITEVTVQISIEGQKKGNKGLSQAKRTLGKKLNDKFGDIKVNFKVIENATENSIQLIPEAEKFEKSNDTQNETQKDNG